MTNMITYDFSQGCNYEVATRPNRALKRAWAQDFTLPAQYTDIDSEEMQYIEGGGRFTLNVSCTAGGFVSGVAVGVITGFITGFFSGFSTKAGSAGGWAGALIGAAVGAIAGSIVSTFVNDIIYGRRGGGSITVINIWIPCGNRSYNIDIGEKIGSALGGGIGGGISGALAAGIGFGYGLAT